MHCLCARGLQPSPASLECPLGGMVSPRPIRYPEAIERSPLAEGAMVARILFLPSFLLRLGDIIFLRDSHAALCFVCFVEYRSW